MLLTHSHPHSLASSISHGVPPLFFHTHVTVQTSTLRAVVQFMESLAFHLRSRKTRVCAQIWHRRCDNDSIDCRKVTTRLAPHITACHPILSS